MASENASASTGHVPPTKAKDQPPQGGSKLSNTELKRKAKEEKAARRAASKATTTPAPSSSGAPSSHQGAASDAKGAKPKPKQDPSGAHSHGRLASRHAVSPGSGGVAGGVSTAAAPSAAAHDGRPKIPTALSHLSIARRIPITQADKDVHPVVLTVGQWMSHFALSDSITRLEATLSALKKVIDSYSTPHGATFSRHFTAHILNPQIDYLTACRPMCFSMGNAIRWLKLQVSKIDIDLPDSDAKQFLCQSIDNFIRERITLAHLVIVKMAVEMIKQDDVVLTYAHHHLVERSLLQAKANGKSFRVIIADDPWERVGIDFAKRLAAAGIRVTYAADFGAVRARIASATTVLLGAEAIFSSGAMYARSGTCDLAAASNKLGICVTALCETINFTERLAIDALTYNEMDPERDTDDECRLLFDTTSDKFLSSIICEVGKKCPNSVPAILRKLEEL
ncbi:hypothetical protein CDD81_5539 [Ophiocordyceps australis]|uniref:Translation initiation factor eIF2B subunit delta n=1 Tax=Ophiocordyceps australis TaxID=1399860 RepID=A0A2C5Y9Z7_9HYPO|nr:hypothetical protein CDD81_5539 [Ophiocordyceps australis]